MTTRSIQPTQAGAAFGEYDVHQPVPYPYHIDSDGNVLRQDFWRGDPSRLIGFQATHEQHVDLFYTDWFEGEADAVVGMYPVFVTDRGGMYTDTRPIASVA